MGGAVTVGTAALPRFGAVGQSAAAGTVRYSRDIPVKVSTDVMVCGGGPAGVAATWRPRPAPGSRKATQLDT